MDNIEVFDLDDDTPYIAIGDVNYDGIYSVSDVVCLLSFMLGEKPEEFNFRQADVDKNGMITVTDLVCVIDYVMKAENKTQANHRQTPAEVQFAIDGFDARTGEPTDVDIRLMPVEEADEEIAYTAMEFVLTLPEGMTFEKAALTGNVLSHTVATQPLDERRTRILIYSDDNRTLTAGDMLRLTIRPDAVIKEKDRRIALSDARIATPDGDEHNVHSRSAAFHLGTGIDSRLAAASIEGGRVLTITALEATTISIYTTDGRLVRTFDVTAGTTTVELPAGIYIVNSTKVVIF